MSKKLIVVFGGAFNPVTNAHLAIAEQLTNEFDIFKVIFLPVSDLYKKEDMISSVHRVKMLEEVIKLNPKFCISTIETESKVLLRTYQTLGMLQEKYPETQLAFLMGTDNLKDLKNWDRFSNLVSEYKFMVVTRDGDEYDDIISSNQVLRENKHNFINVREAVRNDSSSSYIRELVKTGKSPRYLVPDSVYNYIFENDLYKDKV